MIIKPRPWAWARHSIAPRLQPAFSSLVSGFVWAQEWDIADGKAFTINSPGLERIETVWGPAWSVAGSPPSRPGYIQRSALLAATDPITVFFLVQRQTDIPFSNGENHLLTIGANFDIWIDNDFPAGNLNKIAAYAGATIVGPVVPTTSLTSIAIRYQQSRLLEIWFNGVKANTSATCTTALNDYIRWMNSVSPLGPGETNVFYGLLVRGWLSDGLIQAVAHDPFGPVRPWLGWGVSQRYIAIPEDTNRYYYAWRRGKGA